MFAHISTLEDKLNTLKVLYLTYKFNLHTLIIETDNGLILIIFPFSIKNPGFLIFFKLILKCP